MRFDEKKIIFLNCGNGNIIIFYLACLAPDHLCGDGTTCVISNKVCDGIMDCQDSSDEFNCSKFIFDMYYSSNYVLFTIWIFINLLYQFRTVKKTNSSAKI